MARPSSSTGFLASRSVLVAARGNGGATPERLVGALMNRPYGYMVYSTPAHVVMLDAYTFQIGMCQQV